MDELYEVISNTPNNLTLQVELNGEWQPLTETSLALNGYDVFESFKNKGVNNGVAKMRIRFKKTPFAFKYRSDAESGYDYVIVGKIDTELPTNATYSSTQALYHTRSKQNKWLDGSIQNDGQEHFIEVLYRKDSSTHSSYDKGFIALPKQP